ncbi:MAG: YqgE/AlgH family protein [Chitinophagaceae bacterium]|nr:MAG: YqgE/AlgH family protein [Chitinophagaceae bacterium]
MIEPKAGAILIADPFLKDPNFLRTVVFLCEHREDGSFGFVLNRSYENTLDELLPGVHQQFPVFYGGPVQKDSIHFIHQYPEEIPGGTEVINGVYWGGDFSKLVEMLKNGEIEERKIRFFIGYSGWSAGQLDEEMKEKTWLTAEATRKLLFHPETSEIWKESLRHLGGEYEMMINYPIDPQLN